MSTSLKPTKAALIDSWGRVHLLEKTTTIGRTPSARGIAILEASVSRKHAQLSQGDDGMWSLHDVGSSNGSMINDKDLSGTTQLTETCKLSFGSVGLYFVMDSTSIQRDEVVASTATIRAEDAVGFGKDVLDEPTEPSDPTFAGFPKLPISFFQPAAGGGGLMDIAGRRVQLTTAQFDLMQLLVSRMKEDAKLPIEVRGFSPSVRIISEVSWDTPYPQENHLKQLIRRVRKLIEAVDFGNLIESRRGFGYRLRCIPVDPPKE